jgi:hypothetical protein
MMHRVDDQLTDVVVREPVYNWVPCRRVCTRRAIRSFARWWDTAAVSASAGFVSPDPWRLITAARSDVRVGRISSAR